MADGFLAHQGSIGIAGVVAFSLFLTAWPLGFGAWALLTPPSAGLRRVEGISLGALAGRVPLRGDRPALRHSPGALGVPTPHDGDDPGHLPPPPTR